MANAASYAPGSPSLLRRTIRWTLAFLVLCWIARTGWFFLSADFYPYHGNLARLWLAGRDGLYGLPETAWIILSFAGTVIGTAISWVYSELVVQLGYDPLTMPEIGGSSSPSSNAPSGEGTFFMHILRAGLAFSLGQFVIMFFIMGSGGTVGWRKPGLPVIFQGVAKLVYWLLCAAMGVGLIYLTAQHASIFTAVTASVVVVIGFLFPLIGLLPLWFLDTIVKFHPRVMLLFLTAPFRAGRRSGERTRERARKRSGQKRHHRRDESAYSAGQENRHEESRSSRAPEDNVDRTYEAACETFELSPRQFSQEQVRLRYRELMKKVHPDQQGSSRLAKMVNIDYEFILSYHGWSR